MVWCRRRNGGDDVHTGRVPFDDRAVVGEGRRGVVAVEAAVVNALSAGRETFAASWASFRPPRRERRIRPARWPPRPGPGPSNRPATCWPPTGAGVLGTQSIPSMICSVVPLPWSSSTFAPTSSTCLATPWSCCRWCRRRGFRGRARRSRPRRWRRTRPRRAPRTQGGWRRCRCQDVRGHPGPVPDGE